MAVTEQELQEIVRSVLSQMNGLRPSEQEETGIYDTMEEAIAAAARAQKEIRRMPLEFREKIISNIRQLTLENLQPLAEMGVAETKMGNVGHKIIKHRLVAEKTPGTEDLTTIAWSGDRGLTLVEQASRYRWSTRHPLWRADRQTSRRPSKSRRWLRRISCIRAERFRCW